MSIEPKSDHDLPGLLDIFNLARKANASFPDQIHSMDEFLSVIEGEEILVARMADDLAGFVSVWTPEKFLHHLYVSPLFQGRGIGKALVLETVRRFGLPLSLKCIKANTEACRFYEQLGWQVKEEGMGPEGPYLHYYLGMKGRGH